MTSSLYFSGSTIHATASTRGSRASTRSRCSGAIESKSGRSITATSAYAPPACSRTWLTPSHWSRPASSLRRLEGTQASASDVVGRRAPAALTFSRRSRSTALTSRPRCRLPARGRRRCSGTQAAPWRCRASLWRRLCRGRVPSQPRSPRRGSQGSDRYSWCDAVDRGPQLRRKLPQASRRGHKRVEALTLAFEERGQERREPGTRVGDELSHRAFSEDCLEELLIEDCGPRRDPYLGPGEAGSVYENGEHHGDADDVHTERRDLRDRALPAGMRADVIDDLPHPPVQVLPYGRSESLRRRPQTGVASDQPSSLGSVGPRHRRPPGGVGRVTQRERLERARHLGLDDRHGRRGRSAERGEQHGAQLADP